jgi:DeoR/GlpR family transcriptional regulator of sugar metabolism
MRRGRERAAVRAPLPEDGVAVREPREPSKMLAVERRTRILELLHRQGLATVAELSPIYQVSEETIRRDLQQLADEHGIARTYGGAYITKAVTSDIPVRVRETIALQAKEAIASQCAALVREGETLMLDSSTTALQLATHLQQRKGLTVITNSIRIVERLAGCDGLKVICAGGALRHSQLSFVGPSTVELLDRFHADKAFISCVGVTLETGLTDTDELEADVRRRMLARSREKVLIADNTKLGKTFFSLVAPLEQIGCLVTDREPDAQWLAGLAARGLSCRYPGKSAGRHGPAGGAGGSGKDEGRDRK